MSKNEKRPPEETLRAIEEGALADEAERIKRLSDAEVAEEIRAEGGDPEAIGARGAAFVAKLRRDAWQAEARKKLETARAVLAGPGLQKTRGLSREELVARIEAKRTDPRLGAKLAVAFRNKKLDESTDPELEAMLDAIVALEELEDALK